MWKVPARHGRHHSLHCALNCIGVKRASKPSAPRVYSLSTLRCWHEAVSSLWLPCSNERKFGVVSQMNPFFPKLLCGYFNTARETKLAHYSYHPICQIPSTPGTGIERKLPKMLPKGYCALSSLRDSQSLLRPAFSCFPESCSSGWLPHSLARSFIFTSPNIPSLNILILVVWRQKQPDTISALEWSLEREDADGCRFTPAYCSLPCT